jgi:hypothetical protein
MSDVDDLLDRLESLTVSHTGPFPYAGCRWLQRAGNERHRGLNPDLDLYLSEFAGYRSWGPRILKWPDEKIAGVEARLAQTFFDRFPAYAELKPMLASSQANDVRTALQGTDQTREVLLHLLGVIRNDRNRDAP